MSFFRSKFISSEVYSLLAMKSQFYVEIGIVRGFVLVLELAFHNKFGSEIMLLNIRTYSKIVVVQSLKMTQFLPLRQPRE